MRFELFLAIRFLRHTKRLTLARLSAVAAVVAVAGAVAATVFAVALANGFRREMQTKILQNTAHITVAAVDGADIFDWHNIAEKIAQIKGVESIQAVSVDNALLAGKNNSSYALIRGTQKSKVQSSKSKVQNLRGADSENENQSLKIKDQSSAFKDQPIKIKIGKQLAAKVGLTSGDTATIVSGGGELLGSDGEFNQNFVPVSTKVEIGNVFSTGFYEYDQIVIRASLADWARITGKSGISVQTLEIETADVYGSNQIAGEIERVLGADYRITDWQTANRALFAALTLERRIAVLIVSIVIFAAILNVLTALALAANERRADVALLKTCGASARKIILIFLWQGAILGAIGAIGGGLIGVIICEICNYFGLVNLPPEVYSINKVVLQPELPDILLTVASAFLLSLIASVFPAMVAARVKPIENLRG